MNTLRFKNIQLLKVSQTLLHLGVGVGWVTIISLNLSPALAHHNIWYNLGDNLLLFSPQQWVLRWISLVKPPVVLVA